MPQRVESSVEIEAPVEKVYDYWKTLENLPQFMTNVEEIRPTGPDTTHCGQGSFGGQARVRCKDDPEQAQRGNRVEHRERPGSDSGQVRFQKVDEACTGVEVQMNYWDAPGGKASEVASRIVANPELMVQQDLRNLKDILEGTATPRTSSSVQQSPPPRAAL